jgi:hypothetical protein
MTGAGDDCDADELVDVAYEWVRDGGGLVEGVSRSSMLRKV